MGIGNFRILSNDLWISIDGYPQPILLMGDQSGSPELVTILRHDLLWLSN
jgi:hypothetical protein